MITESGAIHTGDCIEVMQTLDPDSIDAVPCPVCPFTEPHYHRGDDEVVHPVEHWGHFDPGKGGK